MVNFMINLAFGILTFLTGQAKKFQTGNKLKLMTIL